jgi:hypothetical protein
MNGCVVKMSLNLICRVAPASCRLSGGRLARRSDTMMPLNSSVEHKWRITALLRSLPKNSSST